MRPRRPHENTVQRHSHIVSVKRALRKRLQLRDKLNVHRAK
jgi:hypothetical protein